MKFWGGIFLLGAGLDVLLGWRGWPAVFAGHLSDPDSYMRIERILQGIKQGHLVNVVARDQSGAGVLVEWSRLLDVVLWAMAAPLAVVVGWRHALFAAGVALGPLATGVLGVCLAYAARPFAEDGLLWTAALAAAMLPALRAYSAPGTVHYHILLLALIAACGGAAARVWRAPATGIGFLAGLFGGLAIWLTPETMPFILMAFAVLLLRWLDRPIGATLTACAAGFVDVVGLGYIVDPPQGGYLAPEIDRISIVYVVLGVFLLLAAAWLWRLQGWKNLPARRVAGVVVCAGFLLGWVAMYPKVAAGPYGLMDAADRARFFGVMTELQPLRGGQLLEYLLPGALAFGYAAWRAALGRVSWPWAYVALCILVALVLGDRFILFVGFSAAAAGALLPVALSAVNAGLRRRPGAALAARLAVFVAVLLLPELPALVPPGGAMAAAHAGAYPSCDLRGIGALVKGDDRVVALAEAQDAPELLYRTDLDTVGSLYQHGLAGYFRAWAAWRSPPGAAEPAAVQATGAKLILFCRGAARYAPVADVAGTTLWDALEAGDPPGWLRLVARDPATGWQVFEIR
jgi:hypothetical protein